MCVCVCVCVCGNKAVIHCTQGLQYTYTVHTIYHIPRLLTRLNQLGVAFREPDSPKCLKVTICLIKYS